ncbi:MAG: hypothetical protein AB7F59_07415 [Bdellovibrionales bacterium]
MKYRIYFHIDEVARDSVVAANLKALFARQDIQLVYGNRLTSEALKFSQPFDLLIFPSVDLIETTYPVASSIDVPIMILPTEGIGMNDMKRFSVHFLGLQYVSGKKDWASKVTAFCFWGSEQKRIASQIAPELTSKFHVVGHPRHDKRCLAPSKEATSPKPVGFLTRVDLLNTFDDRNVLHHLFHLRRVTGQEYWLTEGRDIEDIIYTMCSDARVGFGITQAMKDHGVDFQLRVHPRENRNVWNNLLQKSIRAGTLAPWDQPFMHWLNSVGHIVSPPSTSFYDAFVLKKKPICYELLNPHRKHHCIAGSDDENPILQYVYRPETSKEVIRFLEEPVFVEKIEPAVEELLFKETNYPYSQGSLDEIVKLCREHLGTRAPSKISDSMMYEARTRYRRLRFVAAKKIRQKTDQSAIFDLDSKRQAWIDHLTHTEI